MIALKRQEPSDNGGNENDPPSLRGDSSGRNFTARAAFEVFVLRRRAWIVGLIYLALFVLLNWLAWVIRFDFVIPREHLSTLWGSLPIFVAVKLILFEFSGQLRGSWRHVTFSDLVSLVRVSVLSLLALAAIDQLVLVQSHVPRSVLLLDTMLTLFAVGGTKSVLRAVREHFWPTVQYRQFRRALLVGTGESAGILAHQIRAHTHLKYKIQGLLLTSPLERQSEIGGIPVLGSPEDVVYAAERHSAHEVLITAGAISGARLRQLLDRCAAVGLTAKIIRPIEDMLDGNHHIPIRDIEINDLLRRDPVELDPASIRKLVHGTAVMVTGAGGSIGSEICRQLLRFEPGVLLLVDRNENSLFFLERELGANAPSVRVLPLVADIGDELRMRNLFERHRPTLVFHAAAHKHVPMMEANVGEAMKNNVLGTQRLVDLSRECGVERFVFISTDKAVNPTSVMGASKQLAERYVHAMSQESKTAFMVVRFGNVLGSAGSVVPIFKQQIRQGGPITVTDPRMTRYFMTIPEAAQLVMQAAAMGAGHEIFVLDMGEPVRIMDLARDLIRLSGLPEDSIEIRVTGMRPGEKLFEELYLDDEETLPTGHPKIRVCQPRPFTSEEVRVDISRVLDRVAESAGNDVIRDELAAVVPEFRGSIASTPHPGNQAVLHVPR